MEQQRADVPTHRWAEATVDPHLSPGDESRGIHDSAMTLEGCVGEEFGDDGMTARGPSTWRLSNAHLDGVLYPKARKAEALGLFEKGEEALVAEHDLPLADPRLRPQLLAAGEALKLFFME